MHEKNIMIKTKDGNLDCKIFINSNINAPTALKKGHILGFSMW